MRSYGVWAGNPEGDIEEIDCCTVEVFPADAYSFIHQCFRKWGYGKDGLFCKQHTKMIESGDKGLVIPENKE